MRLKRLAAGVLWLSAHPAVADNPRKVAISPDSSKGALIFEAPPSPVNYQLHFTRDKENGFFSSNSYWIGVEAGRVGEKDRFIVTALSPGRYRLNAVYQQSKWAACLEASTLTVSVQPGKIAYLGRLDALPTLASIQRNARANKDLKAETFQWHLYRTGVAVPLVSDRDPAGVARAEAFVRQQMPKSSAPVTLADLQWGPYQSVKTSNRVDTC